MQFLDVDLVHLHHGLHHARRLAGIRAAQQLAQYAGNDLPGQAVFVLQPAAAAFLAAGGKLVPQFVDFLLALAIDKQRDGGREAVMRTAPFSAKNS